MLLSLHGALLTWLLVALIWNWRAGAREGGGRHWERWVVLPLQVIATGVLLRDRLVPHESSWLLVPGVAYLFPLAFAPALLQNLAAIRGRGPRLIDIPIVLANAGLLLCTGVAALSLSGTRLSRPETVLLYDYSVLQILLGNSRLALVSTLAWHVPVLCPRRTPTSVRQVAVGLVVPAVCGFVAMMLVAMHAPAERVMATFAGEEPAPAHWDRDLPGGVFVRPASSDLEDPARSAHAPGTVQAWVLPADHPGIDLPRDRRALVLALRAPDDWALSRPDRAVALAVFKDGAERLARMLRPTLLLPFPDPDEAALIQADLRLTPGEWRAAYVEVAARVRAVSPETRIGCALSTVGEFTRGLYRELARDTAAVDVLGPRLQPGGTHEGVSSHRSGAWWADSVTDTWNDWRRDLPPAPALWVLGAGASHMAFGRAAQERFVEGCVARVSERPWLEGLLIDGWRDRGHTLGIAWSRHLVGVLERLPGWGDDR